MKATKALQKNEEKKARPEHVVNLINDALWLFGLMVTVFIAISLASFKMTDPAWSRSVPKSDDIANFGGLFGAYVSDVGYYLFGLIVTVISCLDYLLQVKNKVRRTALR